MADAARDLGGRAAVITGAGSGIGAAIAWKAAELGMHVVLADIDAARIDGVRAELAERGHRAIAVAADVRDASAVDRLRDAAYEAYGSVALLVNNAGLESVGYIWDMTPEHWHRVLGVNASGAFHGIRSFVPRMGVDPRSSYVVNVSSIAAITSGTLNSAYFASKHAVLAMSECLYLECRERFPQVHVSVVCPAAVTTRIFEDAIADDAGAGERTEEMLATMRGHLRDDGMSPAEVAGIVFDRMLDGQFWVPTHPDRFAELAARRARMITGLTAPDADVAVDPPAR